MPAKKEITAEYLIVGEGDGDDAFFRYLCQTRSINGFQIDHASGKDDFENFLKGVQGRSGFGLRKGILIVGDNDESPDASFRNIQKQIGKANLPQPQNSLIRAKRQNIGLGVAVLMLPYPKIGQDSHGCLETLLLPAAERNLPQQVGCLGPYCQCILTVGQHWSRTARDKMRLRCLLSGSSPLDPNVSLKYALKPDLNLIPLHDATFDQIHMLLVKFADWMADQANPGWQDWIKANPQAIEHADTGKSE